MFEKNIDKLKLNISQACKASNRDIKDVKVLAVTKSVSCDTAKELLPLGYNSFAENRVDSFLEKKEYFRSENIEWHLIGTLQRRKVKKVINEIDYFHALDNFKLAEEIQKRANHSINCFVQINVFGEKTKQGVSLSQTINFIKSLAEFDKIKVVGLMAMAPREADDFEIQTGFDAVAKKRLEIENLKLSYAPCSELSMGMSQDYALAIKSGATYVRIGTAFFND
ncbi:YggS family pyridoxal phosphate-dependent enzyme [Vagococcus intermedius]|uniref:Pyridoxal phosphate homeostasis protein n=1 Tax=Vagococcus intermedius TaxID=2991418 RepID=A0AAF0I9W8_9ENTE|nr:YggS family pyridoxal phosphate-dependent enzyme [Vagococcus intermedius]WEG73862.1 YggS family pyridoxal phosphate-dependent enzyme [Vagococcus intermedius]WEG75947.1 YggS family pyridoxal phosphate-dependent enzyme [Vagococcus intermedius]